MNAETLDIQTLFATPGAIGVAVLAAHLRFNKIEARLNELGDHLGVPTIKKKRRWPGGTLLALVLFGLGAVWLCSGCASFKSSMTEMDTNGVTRTTLTRVVTWGDTKQAFEKLRVSHGKTMSVGATGLEQETATTNAVAVLESLSKLLMLAK